MTYKYWTGSEWVRCSKEEAVRRRALGQRVMERGDTPALKPKAKPKRAPVVAPNKPVPTGAAVLETLVGAVSALKPAAEFDLSDEDLEKLTAPIANRED